MRADTSRSFTIEVKITSPSTRLYTACLFQLTTGNGKTVRVLGRALVALLVFWLSACTTSPMSLIGAVDSDTRLLEMGAPGQFNASDAQTQLQQQVPIIYFYAYEAGVLPSEGGSYPKFTTDFNLQAAALSNVSPERWTEVAQAGEASIDLICARYQSALYALDKNRRAALANLTAAQSATVAIMGLALAAQKAIGIVGVSFGLAASLFDTSVSSVLYQLPPASVTSVMNAQREVYRQQETSANPEWRAVQSPIAVSNRLNEYIRYCTPVIIEANVSKVLGQTTVDSNGQLVSQTQPAAGATLPPFVRRSFIPSDLRDKVFALQPVEALIVWRIMSVKLNERSPELQKNLSAMVSSQGITKGDQAQALLRRWIVLDEGTTAFQKEWNDAIAAAEKRTAGIANSAPVKHVSAAPDQRSTSSALENQILALAPQDALAVAQTMYPKLDGRSDTLRHKMAALVGSQAGLNVDNAKPFLAAWFRFDDPSVVFQTQWKNALGIVVHRGTYPPALLKDIFGLEPGPALAVARAMYPKLQERPAAIQQSLQQQVAKIDALNEGNAKSLLNEWIVLENPTPAFEAEWVGALANVRH
jgi:hypothetical protein